MRISDWSSDVCSSDLSCCVVSALSRDFVSAGVYIRVYTGAWHTMATIRARVNADGSTSYQAIIRLKRKGHIIYHETKTFSRERLAQDWARRREVELEAPGAIAKAQRSEEHTSELQSLMR